MAYYYYDNSGTLTNYYTYDKVKSTIIPVDDKPKPEGFITDFSTSAEWYTGPPTTCRICNQTVITPVLHTFGKYEVSGGARNSGYGWCFSCMIKHYRRYVNQEIIDYVKSLGCKKKW